MSTKKKKIILFHDYFENYGGGERLAFYFANIFKVSVHTTYISNKINKLINSKIDKYNNKIIKYMPFIIYFPNIIKKIFV